MLLGNEFVNKQAPKEVWLESIDERPAEIVDPAATTKIIRSRVRKLRRLQSQNFVQRAIYGVGDMLGLHRQSA